MNLLLHFLLNKETNATYMASKPGQRRKCMWSTIPLLAGIRSIGFVHSPLMTVTAGTQRTNLMHITDWMPTFEHIASSLPATGYSGFDQFDAITTGTNAPRDVSFTLLKYKLSNFRNFFSSRKIGNSGSKVTYNYGKFYDANVTWIALIREGKRSNI